MVAPIFINGSTGATDSGGAWTATCHAPGAAGRVIILQVLQDGATGSTVTLDSATNIENLAGTDNAWTSIGSFAHGSTHIQHLWIGRSLSTSAPTATGSNGTSEDLYWRFYEFHNVNTGTTLAAVIEQNGTTTPSTSSGTSGTIADAGVTTTGVDRMALNFVSINDDNLVAAFTGETGGDWAEAIAEYAEASGTDGTIQLQIGYTGAVNSISGGNIYTVFGAGGTGEAQAQSFTVGTNATTTSVVVYLEKQGTPTDNLIVEIQSDASGLPSGTVVGTGGSIAGSTLTTTATPYSLAVSASLTASTTYWLVFRRSGSRDETNFYSIESGDAYSGGTAASLDSATWSTSAWDFRFGIATGSGSTIDGGTTANSDATDAWGVVGFALIGTTAAATTSLPLVRRIPIQLYR